MLGLPAFPQFFNQTKPLLSRLADLPLLFGCLFISFQLLPQPMLLLSGSPLEGPKCRQFVRLRIRLRQKLHLVGQDILLMLVDFGMHPDHLLGAHAQPLGFQMGLFLVPVHHLCQAETEGTHGALQLLGNLLHAAETLRERTAVGRILPEEVRNVAARTDRRVKRRIGAVDVRPELNQISRFFIRRE